MKEHIPVVCLALGWLFGWLLFGAIDLICDYYRIKRHDNRVPRGR